MKIVLLKYHRSLSDKAVTVDNGKVPLFIPKQFVTKETKDFVEVDVPGWLYSRNEAELISAEMVGTLALKRLNITF